MANVSNYISSKCAKKIIQIQKEFIDCIVSNKFDEMKSLLDEQGSYFSKYHSVKDVVEFIEKADFLKGVLEGSLTVTNSCAIKQNGEISSVWTFDFFCANSRKIKIEKNDEKKNLECFYSLTLKNFSLELKVKNDKIWYVNNCKRILSEETLEKYILEN